MQSIRVVMPLVSVAKMFT